jgi:hypothetical protein
LRSAALASAIDPTDWLPELEEELDRLRLSPVCRLSPEYPATELRSAARPEAIEPSELE